MAFFQMSTAIIMSNSQKFIFKLSSIFSTKTMLIEETRFRLSNGMR